MSQFLVQWKVSDFDSSTPPQETIVDRGAQLMEKEGGTEQELRTALEPMIRERFPQSEGNGRREYELLIRPVSAREAGLLEGLNAALEK